MIPDVKIKNNSQILKIDIIYRCVLCIIFYLISIYVFLRFYLTKLNLIIIISSTGIITIIFGLFTLMSNGTITLLYNKSAKSIRIIQTGFLRDKKEMIYYVTEIERFTIKLKRYTDADVKRLGVILKNGKYIKIMDYSDTYPSKIQNAMDILKKETGIPYEIIHAKITDLF